MLWLAAGRGIHPTSLPLTSNVPAGHRLLFRRRGQWPPSDWRSTCAPARLPACLPAASPEQCRCQSLERWMACQPTTTHRYVHVCGLAGCPAGSPASAWQWARHVTPGLLGWTPAMQTSTAGRALPATVMSHAPVHRCPLPPRCQLLPVCPAGPVLCVCGWHHLSGLRPAGRCPC